MDDHENLCDEIPFYYSKLSLLQVGFFRWLDSNHNIVKAFTTIAGISFMYYSHNH